MEDTITIQNEVEKLLQADATISNLLSEGVFNINALSNKIIKEYLPDANVIAVSSAIRRYQERFRGNNNPAMERIYGVLKLGKISTRDDVVKVILEKSEHTHSLLAAFSSKIRPIQGHLFRFTEGIEHALVVIDRGNLELLEKTIGSERVIRKVLHLGQLTLDLPRETLHIPGIYATLLRELAFHGINIEEAHSCETNYLVLVSEKDMLRSYHLFVDLFGRARKFFEDKEASKSKKLQKSKFDEN